MAARHMGVRKGGEFLPHVQTVTQLAQLAAQGRWAALSIDAAKFRDTCISRRNELVRRANTGFNCWQQDPREDVAGFYTDTLDTLANLRFPVPLRG